MNNGSIVQGPLKAAFRSCIAYLRDILRDKNRSHPFIELVPRPDVVNETRFVSSTESAWIMRPAVRGSLALERLPTSRRAHAR